MAGPLRDLELLMDHNTKLASSAAPQAAASLHQTFPSSSFPSSSPAHAEAEEEKSFTLHSPHPHPLSYQHRSSLLASLSLAFSPVLSFNPCVSKPCFPSSNAKASSAVKLPSQKKCISPMPVMPAISVSATSLDMAVEGATTFSVGMKKKFSSAFPDYMRLPDGNNSYGNPSDGGAMRKASVVWFRNDLRCHDNEALSTASKESVSVLPVYIFDRREFGKSFCGFDKTGPHRARFLLQCVSNLRENLKELGSDLVIRVGKPEEVLLNLVKAIGADALYAHQEVSYEGMQTEKKISAALQEESVDVKYFWGNTLFHVDDLPFKVEDMPATYSAFHEKASKVRVRDTVETLKQLKGFPIRGSVKPGDMPSLEELGVKPISASRKESLSVATPLIGGEKEALQRLERLVTDYARQSSSKANNKSSLYGSYFSSKISPWLSLGCLSPRHVFEEFRNTSNNDVLALRGSTASQIGPNWLFCELLWRDFFRFVTKKNAASRFGSEASKTTSVAATVYA